MGRRWEDDGKTMERNESEPRWRLFDGTRMRKDASCRFRETDLMDSHGIRKACQWIGNSMAVAEKHYALMKKSDYLDAGTPVVKSDAKSDAELCGIGQNSDHSAQKNPAKRRVGAAGATRHGLETESLSQEKTQVMQESDAKSDAGVCEQALLDAWKAASNEQRRAALVVLGCAGYPETKLDNKRTCRQSPFVPS